MLSYVIKLILLLRNATCIKINKAEQNRVGSNLVCMNSECEIWQNFTTTICYIESHANAIFKVCHIYIHVYCIHSFSHDVTKNSRP